MCQEGHGVPYYEKCVCVCECRNVVLAVADTVCVCVHTSALSTFHSQCSGGLCPSRVDRQRRERGASQSTLNTSSRVSRVYWNCDECKLFRAAMNKAGWPLWIMFYTLTQYNAIDSAPVGFKAIFPHRFVWKAWCKGVNTVNSVCAAIIDVEPYANE